MPQLSLFSRLMLKCLSSTQLCTNLWSGVQLRYCKSSQLLRLEELLEIIQSIPLHLRVNWSRLLGAMSLHSKTCTSVSSLSMVCVKASKVLETCSRGCWRLSLAAHHCDCLEQRQVLAIIFCKMLHSRTGIYIDLFLRFVERVPSPC